MLELGEVCKAIVKSHKDILTAVIIDGEEAVDFYVRPRTPIPDDFRTRKMIIQTQWVVSIIKQSQDYLGELSFTHIHMGWADVLHVPLGHAKVLAVVIKPQKVNNDIITKVLEAKRKIAAKER